MVAEIGSRSILGVFGSINGTLVGSAKLLTDRQLKAWNAHERGILCKVNSVMIPGIERQLSSRSTSG